MGVRLKSRVFQIQWPDDHDMAGVVVQIRARRMREVIRIFELRENRMSESANQIIDIFGEALVSWNIDDDQGNPIPANADGIRELEDWQWNDILDGYWEAVNGVDGPLSGDSSNGGQPPVELPPMDEL
jgi:hypothetical protein